VTTLQDMLSARALCMARVVWHGVQAVHEVAYQLEDASRASTLYSGSSVKGC